MHTQKDAARILGLEYHQLRDVIVRTKVVPPPTRQIGISHRRYYNDDDVKKLRVLLQDIFPQLRTGKK